MCTNCGPARQLGARLRVHDVDLAGERRQHDCLYSVDRRRRPGSSSTPGRASCRPERASEMVDFDAGARLGAALACWARSPAQAAESGHGRSRGEAGGGQDPQQPSTGDWALPHATMAYTAGCHEPIIEDSHLLWLQNHLAWQLPGKTADVSPLSRRGMARGWWGARRPWSARRPTDLPSAVRGRGAHDLRSGPLHLGE